MLKKEKDKIKTQLKKKLSLVKKNVDECVIDECKNDKDFKKYMKPLNDCNQKFKGNQEELNKCYGKYLMNQENDYTFNSCRHSKCKDKRQQQYNIESQLRNIDIPYGKKITEIEDMYSAVENELEKCKVDKCGDIYPLKKLKKEQQNCNKYLRSKKIKIDDGIKKENRCRKKYNIDENEAKIFECSEKKCNNLIEKINIIKKMSNTYRNRGDMSFMSIKPHITRKLSKQKISKRIKKLKSKLNSL